MSERIGFCNFVFCVVLAVPVVQAQTPDAATALAHTRRGNLWAQTKLDRPPRNTIDPSRSIRPSTPRRSVIRFGRLGASSCRSW